MRLKTRNTIPHLRVYLMLLIITILNGCATPSRLAFDGLLSNQPDWFQSVAQYERSIDISDPYHIANLFKIDNDIKLYIRDRFTQKNKHKRAEALVDWILDEGGLNVRYDLFANLSPQQALTERRANCLSFTMLLITLANELDMDLDYNDVEIPNTWGQDEDNGVVFYRHVNAVYRSHSKSQVFDLAMDEYDSAFPQKKISQRSAAALFHSNLGIAAMRNGRLDSAHHHAKLSASIDQNNSYLWMNLGVISKRKGNLLDAENFFKTALLLNDFDSLASSNLERLYRQQGKNHLAAKFKRKAERARVNNPYIQFERAKAAFDSEQYRKARKHINRAISLHKLDPSFFELRSRVNQIFRRYKPALYDLEQAYLLAKTLEERGRYFNKVKRVVEYAKAQAETDRRK